MLENILTLPLKTNECHKQKVSFAKIKDCYTKPLLVSFNLSYRYAKFKRPHLIGENLVLPSDTDVVVEVEV